MATKREVMLAGTPAKLAHMLASDAPRVVAPGGIDFKSATPLQTNFCVLYGATGNRQGVQLPAASGQFIHSLLNAMAFDALVYPIPNDAINTQPTGVPALLRGGQLMVAIPARQAWMAGVMPAAQFSGGPLEVDGPLTIGMPPLAPDPITATVVADQLVSRATTAGTTLGGDIQSVLGFNMYIDSTGVFRYVGNGAGAIVTSHNVNQVVGGAIVTCGRLGLAVGDINNAGAGAGADTHFMGALQLISGQPGVLDPFVVVGQQGDVPNLTMFPRRASLIANELVVRADPLVPGAAFDQGGDRVSRFGFNAYVDNNSTTAAQWRYLDGGPAATLTVHETTATGFGPASLRINVWPPGAQSALITGGGSEGGNTGLEVFGPAGTAANYTSLGALVNRGAGPTFALIQIGIANSGGTGFRALVVPN